MGIDRELIVSEFGKEDCACNICTQLVEDPIVLKCEHFFCKKCIDKKNKDAAAGKRTRAEKSKAECPECKRVFNPTEDMNPPSIFMRNAMSKIKLKCSLFGCTHVVKYDNFTAHIAECSFNPDMEVKCNHCRQLYKKQKEKEHVVRCTPMMEKTVYDHFDNHSPISKDWKRY